MRQQERQVSRLERIAGTGINIIQEAGDMLGHDTIALARIARGQARRILQVKNSTTTGLRWARSEEISGDIAHVNLYKDQHTQSTTTPVSFATAADESAVNMWDISDPTKIIIPADAGGMYLLHLSARWRAAGGFNITAQGRIFINGTATNYRTAFVQENIHPWRGTIAVLIFDILSAGDEITARLDTTSSDQIFKDVWLTAVKMSGV